MSRRSATLLAAIVAVVVSATPAFASDETLRIDDITVEAVGDRQFVSIDVVVPSSLDDQVLPTEAFTIVENDAPAQRPFIGGVGDGDAQPTPRTVLAIDTSGSMRSAIADAKQAADRFVAELPPGAEIAVVTFGETADVLTPFTADADTARAQIAAITVDPAANTALYAGVETAADLLGGGADRRQGVVVLSDGGNTVAGVSAAQARQTIAANDAELWAVSLQTGESDVAALEDLTGDSQRVLQVADAAELESTYTELASELSRRYVLRYETTAVGQAQIVVSVQAAGVTAQTAGSVTIDPSSAAGAPAPATADLQASTVTVPLLATTPAFVVGLAALASGSLILWLVVLLPRRRSTRELLLTEATVASGRARPQLSSLAEWTTEAADRRLRGARAGVALDRALERAGLDLRPGELVIIAGSATMVAYAVGAVAAGPLLGVLLAIFVPLLTRLLLSVLRDRRQAAFSEQLTDVLQLMSSSLRAGYGMLQGIDAVARDAEEPAASEFRRIIIEHRLGRDLNDAMDNCAARMDNDDFAWVVQAVAIHREVGGDLSQVLDNIVATVRDRADVMRQVRSMSAEGRLSAVILTALPFVVLVGISLLSPEYLQQLTGRPIGLVLLAVAGLMMLTGTLWIRRLVRVEF